MLVKYLVRIHNNWEAILKILNGIADTAAQTITSIRGRPILKSREVSEKDMLDIELDKKGPLPKYKADLIQPLHNSGQSFDFDRYSTLLSLEVWCCANSYPAD